MIDGTPSGSVDIVDMEIEGLDSTLISAGPYFKFTPAISFLVALKTKDEAAALWKRLSTGGVVLMDFGAYPFSEAYGWTADRFGISWQIVPAAMDTMLASGDRVAISRVTKAFLSMKKFDLAALEGAFGGR